MFLHTSSIVRCENCEKLAGIYTKDNFCPFWWTLASQDCITSILATRLTIMTDIDSTPREAYVNSIVCQVTGNYK